MSFSGVGMSLNFTPLLLPWLPGELALSIAPSIIFMLVLTLHMVAAPAVRPVVKTELSCQNDMIIVFFFAANKSKDNAQVALASSNT